MYVCYKCEFFGVYVCLYLFRNALVLFNGITHFSSQKLEANKASTNNKMITGLLKKNTVIKLFEKKKKKIMYE